MRIVTQANSVLRSGDMPGARRFVQKSCRLKSIGTRPHAGTGRPSTLAGSTRQRCCTWRTASRSSERWPLPRSTLAQWVGQCGVQLRPLVDALKAEMMAHAVLHADETPVEMLKPGTGKTHKAYLWAYSPGVFEPLKAVVYDFADSRSGGHARAFLGDWRGSLICDDYGGYKASFANGITEVGCMAHARRKFFDLHANGTSQIAGQALQSIGLLYDIEREVQDLSAEQRQRIRQDKSRRIADTLHSWMLAQRSQVAHGGATARALDYSLKRWQALTRFIDNGRLPIDNWIENQIRPIASGRKNWLFAGSLLAGQRAGRHHESDPVSQAQWPRSARLSARRAATPAYAQGKSDRRVADASLGARGKLNPAC